MWTCNSCGRSFNKVGQPHSCRKIDLDEHFKNKQSAKKLFNYLVKNINERIGVCQIVSIPCCIHLFGKYDFLAIIPKKDRLEIRFALERKLNSLRLKQSVPVSLKNIKNCIDINNEGDVNEELLGWLNEAYYLKEEHKHKSI